MDQESCHRVSKVFNSFSEPERNQGPVLIQTFPSREENGLQPWCSSDTMFAAYSRGELRDAERDAAEALASPRAISQFDWEIGVAETSSDASGIYDGHAGRTRGESCEVRQIERQHMADAVRLANGVQPGVMHLFADDRISLHD